jgi:hypothetical protein
MHETRPDISAVPAGKTVHQAAEERSLQLLTNSSRNSFGTCHRRYYYEHVLLRRPAVDAEALRFGNLVHQALEQYLLAFDVGQNARLAKAVAAIYARAPENLADEYQVASAIAMIYGYDARWGSTPMEVAAVEQEFQFPLINPDTNGTSRTWLLAGKIDGIAELPGSDGSWKLSILEHKTTSEDISPESDYWTLLAIDGQVSAYFPGSRSLGYAVEELVYDVLKKPELRPRQVPILDAEGLKQIVDAECVRVRNLTGAKDWRQSPDAAKGYTMLVRLETPEEFGKRIHLEVTGNVEKYFARKTVVRLDADLAEYMGDMWAVGREIADAKVVGRWPRNPRSCKVFSTCPYFDVCAGRESIDNPHRFKDSDPHPELPSSHHLANEVQP